MDSRRNKGQHVNYKVKPVACGHPYALGSDAARGVNQKGPGANIWDQVESVSVHACCAAVELDWRNECREISKGKANFMP